MLYAAIGHRLARRSVWLGGQLLVPLPFIALVLEVPLTFVVVAMALAGVGSGPLNPLMVTIRHERSPVHLRGRVFSTFSAAAQLAGPMGMMIVGVLIDAIGLSTILAGLAALTVVLWIAQLFVPQFRQMDAPDPQQ
jgi:MFS family permease